MPRYGRPVLERSLGLSDHARDAIAALESRCTEVDGGRLKLEWGVLARRDPSVVNDLLWWEGDTLVGFCGRYAFGSEVPEATGMVDPAHRGHGIGTAMLGALRTLCAARGDTRFLLVTSRTCPAARSLAERFDGTFDHAEHALVLTALRGEGRMDPGITLRRATPEDAQAVHALHEAGFGRSSGPPIEDDPSGATLVAERDGRVIATMRLAFDPASRGIYGFVVDPALRGRGIGRDLLRRVCDDALAGGTTHVHLEVSTDNDHALGLYTSVGFEVRATEDYYEIPVSAG